MAKKKSEHYVNNKEFLEALIIYKSQCVGLEVEDYPPVSDYIADCFLKISNGMSHNRNFINYPFRDDMVLDAVCDCLRYVHNFNPEKSENPFAYFSQYAYNAFIRRIQSEKQELYTKYKLFENLKTGHMTSGKLSGDETEYGDTINLSEGHQENANDFVRQFEESLERKREKVKAYNNKKVVDNEDSVDHGYSLWDQVK